MKIKYITQVNYDNHVEYEFNGDVITATVDGVTEVFDFTDMPNDSIMTSITMELVGVQAILSAKRDNDGVLWIELFKVISETELGTIQEWEEV
tara:strand:+ start:407 stop:685 length:279 start_codon:yes stop_codon:yes gene_type:complete